MAVATEEPTTEPTTEPESTDEPIIEPTTEPVTDYDIIASFLQDNDSLKCVITNNSGEDIIADGILAIYDESGALVNLTLYRNMIVPANDEYSIDVEYTDI